MMATMEQRMAQLEARVAQLEGRIASLEAKHLTIGPSNPYQPVAPYPYPYNPPYTITCKMADGTTKEMTLTSPIVAQTNLVK
jgi:hypothetical protein